MSASKKKKSNKKSKNKRRKNKVNYEQNKKVSKQEVKNIDDNIKNTEKEKKIDDKNLTDKITSTENEIKNSENKVKDNSKSTKKKNKNQKTKTNKDENIIQNSKEITEKKEETNNKKETLETENDENINQAPKKESNEVDKIQKQSEKDKNESKEKNNYLEKSFKNRKRKICLGIIIIVISILIILFSTCFAMFNNSNEKIAKGISIKNIDISGLSKEEAINKINEAILIESKTELNLNYQDNIKTALNLNQIDFQYKVEESIEEAYNFGKDKNLVVNNYKLLYANFFGKNIKIEFEYNEDVLNNFIDDLNSKMEGLVIQPSYYIEESTLIINKGNDGIQIKKEELKNKIIKEITNRNFEDIVNTETNFFIEIPIEDVKADDIDFEKIYSEIYTEPQNAYFELEPYKIFADVDGIDLNISIEDAKKIINQEDKDEYRFDLKITKAEKTISDLDLEAFPYIISSFSTRYNAREVNRSTNLKIAAEKINGKVLMPGEEFSYNKVLGKRTVEEGYKDAKIYADGGVVDGLAGGICQISSTLYNAVLLANLQITERRNHSYTTSYVSAGRDATVVYGAIDFKFVNSRSYPIKIEASVDKGIAEFKIHGMKEETEYEINILPVTTQSIPYTTQYIEDPTLAPGQQVVSQAGHAGYKVTTYKEIKLDGNVISKDIISNDTYTPMKAIIRVGPVVQ